MATTVFLPFLMASHASFCGGERCRLARASRTCATRASMPRSTRANAAATRCADSRVMDRGWPGRPSVRSGGDGPELLQQREHRPQRPELAALLQQVDEEEGAAVRVVVVAVPGRSEEHTS